MNIPLAIANRASSFKTWSKQSSWIGMCSDVDSSNYIFFDYMFIIILRNSAISRFILQVKQIQLKITLILTSRPVIFLSPHNMKLVLLCSLKQACVETGYSIELVLFWFIEFLFLSLKWDFSICLNQALLLLQASSVFIPVECLKCSEFVNVLEADL